MRGREAALTGARMRDKGQPSTERRGRSLEDRLLGGKNPGPGHAGRARLTGPVERLVAHLAVAFALVAAASALLAPARALALSDTVVATTQRDAYANGSCTHISGDSGGVGSNGYTGYASAWVLEDGTIAYCASEFAHGAVRAGTWATFHRGTRADAVLSYIIAHGYPTTTTIGDSELAEGDARLATAFAVWAYTGESLSTSSKTQPIWEAALRLVDEAREKGEAEWERNVYYLYQPEDSGLQSLILAPGEGTLSLRKVSTNPSITNGNPCYSLEGARYDVSRDYAMGDVVGQLVCDASGNTNKLEGLSAGTYYVREREDAHGQGYAWDSTVHEVEVVAGQDATLEVADVPQMTEAQIQVQKLDAQTGTAQAQGDASLAGAEFTVRYYAGYYDELGALPAEATRTWVIKTDASGRSSLASAQTNPEAHLVSGDDFYSAGDGCTLPLGTVTIQETKAPAGYLLPDTQPTLSVVRASGEGERVEALNMRIDVEEQVARGDILVQKLDHESLVAVAQGAASLSGSEISITNVSKAAVVVDGVSYAPGEVISRIQTNEAGIADTRDANCDGTPDREGAMLPVGTYELAETRAPKGYKLNSTWHKTVQISAEGELIDLTGESSLEDQVKRGDARLTKASFPSERRMANVAFLMSSNTTGEAHIIVTDENGEWASASSRNPHASYTDDEGVTHATNASDAALGSDGATIVDELALDALAGTWFSGYAEGTETAPNDELGALPYDSYTIRELRCSANEGQQLVSLALSVSRDGYEVDLGTVSDTTPRLSTRLGDGTGKQELEATETVELIDRVDYEGLLPNESYTIELKLWDSTTQAFLADANGDELCVRSELSDEDGCGWLEQRVSIDASELAGHSIVAFEYVYDAGGSLVGEHADETDSDQSVRFAAIETQATGPADDHCVPATGTAQVSDRVDYSGLRPGVEYHLCGTLHLKGEDGSDEGVLADAEGNEIMAETSFVPTTSEGSVVLEFSFDASLLAGRELVAFEELTRDGRRVAVHADISDEGQTVRVAKISTSASGEDDTKLVRSAADATITDTVSFENLTPGATYELTGTIHIVGADGEDAGVLTGADGSEAQASTTFVPGQANGSAELTFTIDTSQLQGRSLVVFELLTHAGVEYARHADISDEGQTVRVAQGETELVDQASASHEATLGQEVVLIDEVSYQGLVPGREYSVGGVLMDKATGAPLLNAAGEEVRSTTVFTPSEPDGSVEVSFTIDSTLLAGKTIVAFETCESEGKTWFTHADLSDEGQSVSVPRIATTLSHGEDDEVAATGTVCLTDIVAYENLLPETSYELTGTLHVRSKDGEDLGILMGNGSVQALAAEADASIPEGALLATASFTTPAVEEGKTRVSGTAEVSFEGVNLSALAGNTIVAFEELSRGVQLVATHANIADNGQSLDVVKPPTKTTLPKTGETSMVAAAGMAGGLALMAGVWSSRRNHP